MVMTPEAAMQLRWEEEMGSLEVGKLANMVLHPRIVIFDGNVISGSSLWYNESILTIS